MKIYLVRLFIDNKWHTIRSYAVRSEAELFASLLSPEWDIKEVSLEEALAEEEAEARAGA
jgi:hypothetical protein